MGQLVTTAMLALGAASLLGSCQDGGQRQPSAADPDETSSLAHPPTAPAAGSATTSAGGSPDLTGPPQPAPEPAAPEGMVKIPAGVYLMGADAARGNPEEKPAHEAIVASFYLDLTEVTFGAYQRCIAAGACTATVGNNPFCNHKFEDRADHPVNCIDLRQAAGYCTWAGKRLPTEREWEYVASAGTERRRFAWGEEDPTPARACYGHPGGSCPVATFEPTAHGLYDLTGNVWEWTASAFLPYPTRAKPDAIEAKQRYVYRGGSWSRRFPKWMRNMIRNRYFPDEVSASLGMRCAQSISPVECPAETALRGGACQRISGAVLCEAGQAFDGTSCAIDRGAALAHGMGGAGGPSPRGLGSGAPALPSATPTAPPTITRSRTPAKDADCRRNWPATPAAYLFRGGHNYPSRKPAVSAAGCVPRDMGWQWTSACCPG